MKKRIFLAFFTLCFLIALCAMPVGAETTEVASGTCGTNLTWTLDSEGTLTISGTGSAYSIGWSDYIDSITSAVVGEGITSVGCFKSHTNLRSVSLPAPLKR